MLDRYTLPEMRRLWGRSETRFERWLNVELAVLEARAELGFLALEVPPAIKEHAGFSVERIRELERLYDHDMIAFVVCVQEFLERAGTGQWKEEFHKTLTSYDVEDPALVLMLREALELVLTELRNLEVALRQKAGEHKWTLMIARTHGQYAEPTTLGQLLLVFAEAVSRSIRRLNTCLVEELGEGKISGAVGTYAGMDVRVEERALAKLGLKPAKVETQILQRDRHAAVLSALATAAGTIEQMARTFWEMMRSDVGELQEPRTETQRGSSAMAHKKNPILTERLMGMSRLVRGAAHAAQENIATPESRDISQSSVERHILPDATALLHYMANKATGLVQGLVVFKDRMRHTLENRTQGVWAGQQIRNALMEVGVPYDLAYLHIQQASFATGAQERHLAEVLCEMPLSMEDARTAQDILGKERFTQCFNAERYLTDGIEHIFRKEGDR
jgi:adenylosuccinate lyase